MTAWPGKDDLPRVVDEMLAEMGTPAPTIVVMRLGWRRWRAVWAGAYDLQRWETASTRDKVIARAEARLLAEQNTREYQEWVAKGRPL